MQKPISRGTFAVCCALLSAGMLSASGCTSSTTDDGVLVVDLRTGQQERIGRGEPVPEGYSECPNDVCPELTTCAQLSENECLSRNDCFPVYSEDGTCSSDGNCTSASVRCEPVGNEPPPGGGTCEPSDCPSEVPAIARICNDGSTAVLECLSESNGACGWRHVCSEDNTCEPTDCPDEVPAIARICNDGSTAPLECLPEDNGACGWRHVCSEDGPVDPPPAGTLCPDEQCPGQAPAIGSVCSDGSSAENVCRYEADGSCGWNLECPEDNQPTPNGCVVGGCSGELCVEADGDPVASPCIWRAEFACYDEHGTCERQANGSCGWTSTPELDACLANPPQPQ